MRGPWIAERVAIFRLMRRRGWSFIKDTDALDAHDNRRLAITRRFPPPRRRERDVAGGDTQVGRVLVAVHRDGDS
jgi:hypothetical protein